MRTFRHPHQSADYTLREDGAVDVTDVESGAAGVFAVGGRHLSGKLREADVHFIRYVADCSGSVAAINAELRSKDESDQSR